MFGKEGKAVKKGDKAAWISPLDPGDPPRAGSAPILLASLALDADGNGVLEASELAAGADITSPPLVVPFPLLP